MPLLQAELVDRLKSALPPATTGFGQLLLLNDTRSSFSFTATEVNAATGTITIVGQNFTAAGSGTRVRFPTASPGGLALNTDYWARDVVGDAFKLSATPGGAAIATFSSTGSGTMTISDQPLSASDQVLATPAGNTAQWVRKEVAGSTRVSANTPAATAYTIATVNNLLRAVTKLEMLINNSGTSTLTFSKILLLVGGTLTTGDTTGTPRRWWEVTGSVAAGEGITYLLNAFESN